MAKTDPGVSQTQSGIERGACLLARADGGEREAEVGHQRGFAFAQARLVRGGDRVAARFERRADRALRLADDGLRLIGVHGSGLDVALFGEREQTLHLRFGVGEAPGEG